MAKRLSLAFLGIASIALLVSSLGSHPLQQWSFATLGVAFPVVMMAVGAAKRGRLGPTAIPIVSLLVLLELAVVGMLVFSGRVADGPWLLGLPLAAAIQLYGVFLAPLAIVAVGYALTFHHLGVREEDLERLRALGRDRDDH